MAEAWTRHFGGDRVEVQSAGIETHGKNPRAIAVMQEAGVDISGQESTMLSDAFRATRDEVNRRVCELIYNTLEEVKS